MANDAPDVTKKTLEKAAKGLLYPSESDVPFEVLSWDFAKLGAPSSDSAKAAAGAPADAPVRAQSVDELLGPLAAERADFDDGERKAAARFKELAAVVKAELSDVHVFRVGSPDVVILLVGKAKDGSWLGLKTGAVET